MACRLAIAGSIIDFSVGLKLEHSDIVKSVEDSIKHDVFGTATTALREAVEKSKNIMYIASKMQFGSFCYRVQTNGLCAYKLLE